MKKKICILLVLAFIISLAACNKKVDSPASTSGSTPASDPVAITIAFELMANSLDVLAEDSTHNISIAYHIFHRLVEFDTEYEWHPGIAKSWERIDNLTWEFDINLEDYVFQNGDPLTMDDIVFSILRLKDVPKTADNGALIESVTYEGTKLRIKMVAESNTTLPRVLSTAVIVNKAYIEANGESAINLNPIGTGPYKVTQFTPGTSLTIETWDGYRLEKPQIDSLTFIAIADLSARYIAVETGQIQYAGWLSSLEYDLAVEKDGVSAISLPSKMVNCLSFNCERPPFDNVNVRKALSYAVDRATFCTLLGGRVPVESMLFGGWDMYVASPNLPEYDLEKAKAMLAEEGFDESNPLSFELFTYQPNEPGLQFYQSTLKSIGVDVSITIAEFSVYIDREGRGDFDVIWTSQVPRGGTPLMDLDRFDYAMVGVRNGSRYNNPRVQEIIARMRITNDDQEMKDLNVEINEILADEVPMYPVYLIPIFSATDSRLDGVVIGGERLQLFNKATFKD